MFIISFFSWFYGFLCILTILLILVQRGKGSMGLGNFGGANQMLFGGSGGQDIFQKITWILVAIILFSSFGLAILRNKFSEVKINYKRTETVPTNPDYKEPKKEIAKENE